MLLMAGEKDLGSEVIGFFLFSFIQTGYPSVLEENVFLPMEEDVPNLMEEVEPQVVISFVSSGQLNYGSVPDPSGGSVDWSLWQSRSGNQN